MADEKAAKTRKKASTAKAKPAAKKAPARKSAAAPRSRRAAAPEAAHDEIAFRAYMLHLEGHGDELANWLRAETELRAA